MLDSVQRSSRDYNNKRLTGERTVVTTAGFVQRLICKLFLFARGFLTTLMLCGCVSTSVTSQADSSSMSQMIVKFKDPAVDPTRSGYIQELSQAIGATLVYVRPMSGGAHILRLEAGANAESVRRVVESLAKRADVEYAEPDQLLHPMQR